MRLGASSFVVLSATVLMIASLATTVLCNAPVPAKNPSLYLTESGNSGKCIASLREPFAPRALEFCFWQNSRSCCTPANDAAAKKKFSDFTDLGPGCAPTDHKIRAAYREVRQFACLPCDPLEPKYRVVTDAATGSFGWRVCLSFFFGKDNKSGLWGTDGRKFDACGIKPAGSSGVDFTIPSVAYGTGNQNNRTAIAEAFLQDLPSFISGFGAILVNDYDPNFNYDATPCFASAGSLLGAGAASVVAVFLVALAFAL